MARIGDIFKALCMAPSTQREFFVVRYSPNGHYLAVGGALTAELGEALRFPNATHAAALVERHACERGGFEVVELHQARAA